MVTDLVLGDRAKPAAKCVAWFVAAKIADGPEDGLKDLLHHVRCILRLQTRTAAPGEDKRCVQFQQPVPGLIVTSLQALDQTVRDRLGRTLTRPAHPPLRGVRGCSCTLLTSGMTFSRQQFYRPTGAIGVTGAAPLGRGPAARIPQTP